MQSNTRYPLILLAALLSNTFPNFTSASSMDIPGNLQPSYPPVVPTVNIKGYGQVYRFRPLRNHPIGNYYRPPMMADMWSPNVAGMPAYPYSLQFRPAQSYAPWFSDRVASRSARYDSRGNGPAPWMAYAGYHPENFQYRWQRHPILASKSDLYSGYGSARIPSWMHSRSVGQENYFTRFRPMTAFALPADPQIVTNWGSYPPRHWRVPQPPRYGQPLTSSPQLTSVEMAYAPRLNNFQKRAGMWPKSDVDGARYTSSGKPFLYIPNRSLNRAESYKQNSPIAIPYPAQATSLAAWNPNYDRSVISRYRFRMDDRLTKSLEPQGVEASRSHGGSGYPTYSVPPVSAKFRFRPNDRFSWVTTRSSKQLFPISAVSEVTAIEQDISQYLNRASTTATKSIVLDAAKSLAEVDLSSSVAFEPIGSRAIERFPTIVDNRIDR